MRKNLGRTYFYELHLENFKFQGRYFVTANQKFNFTEDIFPI